LRTFGKPRRNFVRFGVELGSKADETDSLGVGAKRGLHSNR
jgi:hypothetical protein